VKWIVAAVIITACAGATLFLLGSPLASSDAGNDANADGAQLARLSAQVEALQRELSTVEAQLATRQAPVPVRVPATVSRDVEQERAEEAEKQHEYVATIAQAFARQKTDPAWATRASSRVEAVFGNDEALQKMTRNVECRDQTCRVEIEDDGTGQLNGRMPFIAMGLSDVLPNISAERVDRGGDRSSMVLYLSSQPLARAAPVEK